MSAASKPTAGPWRRDLNDPCIIEPIDKSDRRYIAVMNPSDSNRADGDIVIEAGTVYHETGLTPRQLAEQRTNAQAALAALAAQNVRSGAAYEALASQLAEARGERDELRQLVREVLLAGNANTRAIKELVRQSGVTWFRRARALLAKGGAS